jgi:cobalt-zinc-cadmium efflux system membrane fusion protein
MHTTAPPAPGKLDHIHPGRFGPTSPTVPELNNSSRPSRWRQKALVFGGIVVAATLAALGCYLFGVPVPHLPAWGKESNAKEEKPRGEPPASGVALVPGKPHTLAVPEDVRTVLGIRKSGQDQVVVAAAPAAMRALTLSGSTALDPTRLARIRARFAPARVVSIGQTHDYSPRAGRTEFRELRPGDRVRKGEILGVFYSVDVASKKNDLLDALIQLELDQEILDNALKHREAVPQVFLETAERAVRGDRNAINRALNNLKLWDIPQEEIDAIRAEARKLSADKEAWSKTPEGRWAKGGRQEKNSRPAESAPSGAENENPWGKVTLRAPFDGVIVERNLHVDEMVVDNTVNLFQIADVSRLLVIANAPEDELPTLEALDPNERRWTVQTVGAAAAAGLSGTIDEIGYLIDPNQHTAVIKGYVENPGQRIRGGQYVTATVRIPPPDGVVAIPLDALVDDGRQSIVFVQTDAARSQYTMRRVQVTHRFEGTVFVRSTPIPPNEQLSPREAEEGLLPKEPLRPGERVLPSGAGELKSALLTLESKPEKEGVDGKRQSSPQN